MVFINQRISNLVLPRAYDKNWHSLACSWVSSFVMVIPFCVRWQLTSDKTEVLLYMWCLCTLERDKVTTNWTGSDKKDDKAWQTASHWHCSPELATNCTSSSSVSSPQEENWKSWQQRRIQDLNSHWFFHFSRMNLENIYTSPWT